MKLLMQRPSRVLGLYWAVTLLLAGNLLWGQSASHPRYAAPRAVTLLTGQVVHLASNNTPLPVAATSRLKSQDGGTLVIPNGAAGEVGVFFDPLLFDPSYQEQQGLGDDQAANVPVLVSFQTREQALAASRQGLIEQGIRITHVFEYLPLASGYVNKHGPFVAADGHAGSGAWGNAGRMPDGSARPDSTGVTGLYLDDTVRLPMTDASSTAAVTPSLNDAIGMIGADVAHRHGLNGLGVTIAVVDTGIDGTHPDLAGRIVAARNFSTDADTIDHFGHGTHVASIAAGTGAASEGKYGGVAPAASLINAKALNRAGQGTESSIIQAMEWAADSGAKVINMSLGGGAGDGQDAMSQAVNAITKRKGVLFAIAAGNSGPRTKVSTPAAADASVAVAAIDKARTLAAFSSRGPRLKDMALKPDIAAPGVAITAARANYGSGDPYATYSGTSMATPMVAGSAALVWQLHPDWVQSQVKDALLSSAAPIGQACGVSTFDQGAGAVNLAAIVDQVAVISPGSVSFGLVTGESRRTAMITNISSAPLSLRLQGGLCSQAAEKVSISPAEITLVPGQSAQFTVTVSGAKKSGPLFGEVLVSEGSKTVARAAIGLVVK